MPPSAATPSFAAMLARFLLALLLAAFAMPGVAPAACHDDAPVAHHAMSSANHIMPMPDGASDRSALAVHACIGCVPPSDWLGPRVARPVVPVAATLVAALTTLSTGAVPAPDLPPPRRG